MAEYIYEENDFRIKKKKELIRCKDCQYQRYNKKHEYPYCALSNESPLGEDQDWCSMGERRKEE